jgi:hypothetical protein
LTGGMDFQEVHAHQDFGMVEAGKPGFDWRH